MRLRPILVTAAAVSASFLPAIAGAQVRAAVITSGNEPAVQIGDDVVARPFGATLVDRVAVAGSQTVGRTTYHLIRGERAGDCPIRYVVIRREADGVPAATAPFGTCGGSATLGVGGGALQVRVPAPGRVGPPAVYRFEGGAMRLVAGSAPAAVAGAAPVDACQQPTRSDPASNAAVLTAFEADYPLAFRRTGSLNKAQIDPVELRTVVTALACLSRWPGAERRVPEVATPLFASRRYGPLAFDLITVIAQDPASDANLRASARAFGAEMLYRVERRQPL